MDIFDPVYPSSHYKLFAKKHFALVKHMFYIGPGAIVNCSF